MFQAAEFPFTSTFPRRMFDMRRAIRSLVRNREAQVVTLRIVLGFGWLMAGVEKMNDPAWQSGGALTLFLQNQLAADAVYFPMYETLISELFLPNAAFLAWLVMVGEWLVGLALITGTLTNVALFFGVVMNLNYSLAGVIDPSILYIVIQGILYSSHAGATFSLDSILPHFLKSALGRKGSTSQEPESQEYGYQQSSWQQPKWYSNAQKSHKPSASHSDDDVVMGGRMKDSNLRDKC